MESCTPSTEVTFSLSFTTTRPKGAGQQMRGDASVKREERQKSHKSPHVHGLAAHMGFFFEERRLLKGICCLTQGRTPISIPEVCVWQTPCVRVCRGLLVALACDSSLQRIRLLPVQPRGH